MGTQNEVVKEFRLIKQEYAYDPGIFNPDDPKVARLKEIIDTKLSQVDKTIVLLYVDCQSFRKLGAKLGVSHMTCRREVMRIVQIIKQEYDDMMEVWRPVKGYEGLYEVSDQGAVRSLPRKVSIFTKGTLAKTYRRGVELKPFMVRKYPNVILYKDGKGKHFQVHRLVASTFIPNPQNLTQINHKDENPGNNRVENLEWCTPQYNGSYGTRPSKYMRKVSQYTLRGEKVATYDSVGEAAKAVGCHYTSISHCCSAKGKEKTAKGFIWKYEHIH